MKYSIIVQITKSDKENHELSDTLKEKIDKLSYEGACKSAIVEAKQNMLQRDYLEIKLYYWSYISSVWISMATYYKENDKLIIHE